MIATHLDLSNCHISQETMEELGRLSNTSDHVDAGWPGMTIASYTYGAFCSVPGCATQGQLDALPDDLRKVLDYARKLGAVLVRFDSDGDTTHNLPIYDW